MPELAGSGSGSDGWQMLFRSPLSPLWPSLQNPNSEPMSPMPGTEQAPPGGAAGCRSATVTAEIGRVELPVDQGSEEAVDDADAVVAAVAAAATKDPEPGPDDGCARRGTPTRAASTKSTRRMRCGKRRGLRILGALLRGGGGGKGGAD